MSTIRHHVLSISLLAAVALPPAGASAHDKDTAETTGLPQTIALFDPTKLETPESIAFDAAGDAFVSLALTGEIRRIAPDGSTSTFAVLPLGAPPLTFCGSFFAGLTGITIDRHDTLYASLASCDPSSRGIWKISPTGQAHRIGALPMTALPNGIVHHHGNVYAADTSMGVLWRVADTGGVPEVWASGSDLAQTDPSLPGPNGLKLFEGEMYVSNPSQGTILAIAVGGDGSAGAHRVHATGAFCDDFAFDGEGSLYCGTDPFDTLLRISPDGEITTLLTASDGLDGPTAVAFGRRGDHDELYITNAAYPFFPHPAGATPSLMRVSLDLE